MNVATTKEVISTERLSQLSSIPPNSLLLNTPLKWKETSSSHNASRSRKNVVAYLFCKPETKTWARWKSLFVSSKHYFKILLQLVLLQLSLLEWTINQRSFLYFKNSRKLTVILDSEQMMGVKQSVLMFYMPHFKEASSTTVTNPQVSFLASQQFFCCSLSILSILTSFPLTYLFSLSAFFVHHLTLLYSKCSQPSNKIHKRFWVGQSSTSYEESFPAIILWQ